MPMAIMSARVITVALSAHLRLGELVIVVRECEVNAARVDVHVLAEDFAGHDRALNVPTGAAIAPR